MAAIDSLLSLIEAQQATAHGLAATLRPISRHAPSLAELNLPESLSALAGAMVLVVGPTGAGSRPRWRRW